MTESWYCWRRHFKGSFTACWGVLCTSGWPHTFMQSVDAAANKASVSFTPQNISWYTFYTGSTQELKSLWNKYLHHLLYRQKLSTNHLLNKMCTTVHPSINHLSNDMHTSVHLSVNHLSKNTHLCTFTKPLAKKLCTFVHSQQTICQTISAPLCTVRQTIGQTRYASLCNLQETMCQTICASLCTLQQTIRQTRSVHSSRNHLSNNICTSVHF